MSNSIKFNRSIHDLAFWITFFIIFFVGIGYLTQHKSNVGKVIIKDIRLSCTDGDCHEVHYVTIREDGHTEEYYVGSQTYHNLTEGETCNFTESGFEFMTQYAYGFTNCEEE